MKQLKLREILLLSHADRRGRKIAFHPKVTVLKGMNRTGKSSVMKSIYWALGATPGEFDLWKNARLSVLLRFEVDDIFYQIYRFGDSFSLFFSDDRCCGTYHSVTNELAPKLADLFDFRLVLSDRENRPAAPPPAFLFLPYYIDQDIGWGQNWSSFERLGQFRDWRRDVIFYHTGIRPNEWYALQSEAKTLSAEREPLINRERLVRDMVERVRDELLATRFDIDVDSYKAEIDRLLRECELLRRREEEYSTKLNQYDTERVRLEAQREIVVLARQELMADYQFAADQDRDHVECPICGAEYSNSFLERFDIAKDEDRCVSLLQEINEHLVRVTEKIILHRKTLTRTQEELSRLNSLLESKQGEVTLQELIENEGKKDLRVRLNLDLDNIQREIGKIDGRLRQVQEKLSIYEDRERSLAINRTFADFIRRNLYELNVTGGQRATCKAVDSKIRSTGSDRPRTYLSYFFAILNVIRKYGSSTFCPIVIDAPRQQEQDATNHTAILQYIRNRTSEGGQLILALVDDCDIDFGGTVIEYNKN